MARFARIVAAGVPHHVTQHGAGRGPVFRSEQDYALYLALVVEHCRITRTAVLAYGLLPKSVHLIVVPRTADSLRKALGQAHKRFAAAMKRRHGRDGKLWHARFASFPLDQAALPASARFIETAPVRAGLAANARAWRWSSARAHLSGADDDVVSVGRVLKAVPDWRAFLAEGTPLKDRQTIDSRIRTGRPMGSAQFVAELEQKLGRVLAKQKPGPKPKRRKQQAKKRRTTK
jgi:putative transposase